MLAKPNTKPSTRVQNSSEKHPYSIKPPIRSPLAVLQIAVVVGSTGTSIVNMSQLKAFTHAVYSSYTARSYQ